MAGFPPGLGLLEYAPQPAFIQLPRGFHCVAKLSAFQELSKASKVGGCLPCPVGANLESLSHLSWAALFQFCLQGPANEGGPADRTGEMCHPHKCGCCMHDVSALPYNLFYPRNCRLTGQLQEWHSETPGYPSS